MTRQIMLMAMTDFGNPTQLVRDEVKQITFDIAETVKTQMTTFRPSGCPEAYAALVNVLGQATCDRLIRDIAANVVQGLL